MTTQTSYDCEKCRDTTWIIVNGAARRCSCYEKNKVKRLWEASGINIEQRSRTFKTYISYSRETEIAKGKAIQYFKEYSQIKDSKHNSIAFLGQVGSGKTHLSEALAVNFLNIGVSVLYMPFRDIMMDIKLNILDEEYYKKSIVKYEKCGILLIDDLYKGKVTGSDLNILFEIINYRYLNNKPIIVSSEKNMEDILNIDEGIGSRIYEMCKGNVIMIKKKENNYRMR